jgi:uncharacterized protein with HEPN domain
MPARGWSLRISDILDAIAAIQGFTRGMDYATFAGDRRTVDAVLYNLMTIGEAANHVPDDVVVAHPEIPWRDMRDMRNVVVHEYFGVNKEILWDTVQLNLPPLAEPLRRLFGEAGG